MSERIADEARAAARDAARAADETTDGAGIWRDPSGVLTIGERMNDYHPLDHRVIVHCASHRGFLHRTAIRKAAKPKRGTCPWCGKPATIELAGDVL